MMKKILLGMALATMVTGAAWAGDKGAADAGKKAPTPAAAEAPPMPKAPDWSGVKWLVGTWSCTGTMQMGGGSMKTTFKMTNKPELDGFWMVQNAEIPKSKDVPMAIKWVASWTMDAAGKSYYQVADNMGAYETGSGDAWKGDTLELNGKITLMGQTMDVKHTWKHVSDKEWHWTAVQTGAMPGGFDWTCKK